MGTVLRNDPEAKRLAPLAALEECTDLQAFGGRCLKILLNSLVSAKADEACGWMAEVLVPSEEYALAARQVADKILSAAYELSFTGKAGRRPCRGDGARGASGAADRRILARPGAEARVGPHRLGGRLVRRRPARPARLGAARQALGEELLGGPLLLLRAERGALGRDQRPALGQRAPDQSHRLGALS